MEEIKCEDCRVEFSKRRVSKILHCGHSFCIDCIFGIKEGKCPVCNSLCNEDELKNPRTNYSLELVLRRREKHLIISEFVLSRFTDTKELIFNLLVKLRKNAPFLQYYSKVNLDLYLIQEKLNVINNPFNSVKLATKCNVQICLQVKDFEDPREFVLTIIEFLKRNYKFYVAHQVEDEILYGRLSLREGWTDDVVFVHSLTEREHEKQANIVWFQDLKHCTEYFVQWTFIENPHSLMVFSLEDLSGGTSEFVKICTGEDGATYKGLCYSTKAFENTDEIGTFSINGFKKTKLGLTDNQLDHDFFFHVKPKIFQKCFVLQANNTGGFNILKCGETGESMPDIIGKMNELSILENKFTLGFKSDGNKDDYIIECGIALSPKTWKP